MTEGALANAEFEVAADHVGNGLGSPLVGHMRDTDFGLDFQHLAEQMIDGAVSGRAVVQLVGIGPRQGKKFLKRIGFCLGADNQ